MFLTPLAEHDLLIFWIQLALLLVVARSLGAVAKRFGQPAVVGELAAGVVLGPSILGNLAPGAAEWLFPGTEVSSAILLGTAWVGIVLLLLVTGFETDLDLLARLGRPAAAVSVGSLVVPLVLGVGLGFVLPESFIGDGASRTGFAMFIAVALSISALPVVARILTDMDLLRRDVGQIILAAGMANDLIGWILLGVVVAVVGGSGFSVGALGMTVVAAAVIVAATLTVGQRVADTALRVARGLDRPRTAALTVTVIGALLVGVVTQVAGMEAVLGAFLAGIVLGRSRYQDAAVRETIEEVTHAVFAPIFFATAGLYLDLAALLDLQVLLWTAVLVLVAAVAKLVGSWAGARVAGMTFLEGTAVGLGLNARGAMEIVLATIGLSLGVLQASSYAAIVVLALATSMAAPPLLRPVLRRLRTRPEEVDRLKREELLRRSVIAHTKRALLPSRGGRNSAQAARILDLALRPEASICVLSVGEADAERVDRLVVPHLAEREIERRNLEGDDVTAAVLAESLLGYDLIAVGLNDDFAGSTRLSAPIQGILAGASVPVLLVRLARGVEDGSSLDPRRVVVPAVGTRVGRAAQELAAALASRADAELDVIHVITRDGSGSGTARDELSRARRVAEGFGREATSVMRRAPDALTELLEVATRRSADTIVIGAEQRSQDHRPFLGHGVEHALAAAPQTVVAVVFPSRGGP